MVEEKTKEDEQEQEEDEETPDTTTPLIEEANKAAKRMEAANAKMEKLVARQEKMQVEKTLGGNTDAGKAVKQEETEAEYADKVMKGEI